MDAKQLYEQALQLFTKRSPLLTLWQEIADHFYPQRADFTLRRSLGTDFAAHLSTSYPVLCRRDLGDNIGSMLRPTEQPWFFMGTLDQRREDNEAKRWLEWATGVQRRAMYDRASLFSRAMKEGDDDFSAFGQCVISVHLNRNADGLLYRGWHLRDVVWMEDQDGKICAVFRRWKPTARELCSLFKNVHKNVEEKKRRDPFCEVEVMHMVVEADMYDDKSRGKPRWSIYYDYTHDHLMEAVPIWGRHYIIPRWQTVSGSQYAFSPATVAALPDARLLQAMTYTLLEAGEKITNPPLIATKEAVRSDVAIYAGGITWVDMEYDERLGEALRPIAQDSRGMPIGIDMQRDSRSMLMQAFYLNKLNLPQRAPEMTAYEVGQRIQEYIRGALPLFEPMEPECNGAVCDETFDVLLRAGAFGPPDSMPDSLRGADIQFRFKSPLHDAIEQQKGQKWLEMKTIIADAVALDQSVAAIPDAKTALRDVLAGIRVPATWLRTEAEVEAFAQAQQKAQQQQQMLSSLTQGSEAAANLAGARRDMALAEAA